MRNPDLHGESFDVLASLRRSGTPYQLSPTELYREMMLTSGAMTNRIDRFEEAGLVMRRHDPADRRGKLVRLDAEGQDPHRCGHDQACSK